MPGSTTYQRYEVTGDDLAALSAAIFDVANGKGTLSDNGQRRYAGRTVFDYIHGARTRFDPAAQQITIEITEIDWTTRVRLPHWRAAQLQAATASRQREYRRFLAAVHRHELGHVYLYNFGMGRVRTALVGTPAGTTTVAAAKHPQFNADGSPATPADQAIADRMDAAARALITGHADFVEMMRKQDRYDAAPAAGADPDSVFAVADPADQPDGTDHGRTQGAVLNVQ